MKRITTIDVTRGIVMIIMALDHVRDLLHLPALTQNPTDLNTTTAPIFLTRWITHLCAPTFVFLSGTSAYLSLQRRSSMGSTNGLSLNATRNFLVKRGLVLIALEVTLINFAFWTDIHFQTLMLQVIFAIGGGLILLAPLSRLPIRWVAIAGFAIIGLHDLLLMVPTFTDPVARVVWSFFFKTELFPVSPHFMLLIAYPLIPWFGLMLVGFACGPVFGLPLNVRKKRLLTYGLMSLGIFVVLRFINIYGDAAPWSVQKTPLFTLLSFMNISKYPPSLLYTAVTLGIMFLMLSLGDGVETGFTRVMMVYGQVPLFYYLIHWYLVKASMIGMMLVQGYSLSDVTIGPLNFGRPAAAGVSLPGVYLVWMAIVLLLYPLCRWYSRYKAAHPEIGWLRYL